MKKIISMFLLAAILTASVFSSACSETETAGSGTEGTGGETPVTDEVSEAESARYMPTFDDTRWDNTTFTFMVSGNTENDWKKNDFAAEELTGEPINDARYTRNLKIEEQFGVTIETIDQYGSDTGMNMLKNSIIAADYAYDAGMIGGYAACNLANQGYLADLNSLPVIDLTQDYWDQKANEDLMIFGQMFYTTGDISTAINDATYCMIFNKQLVEDYSLADPYAMVKDGTWTIDRFTEMVSSVHGDLNGDGKMDTNDLYGALVWDDTNMGIINAAGIKCCTVGDEGMELTLYSEKTLNMYEKWASVVFNKDITYNYQRVSYDISYPISMFQNNQGLFFLQLMDLAINLRSMETDFGILPYPKYDEQQEEYYNTVGTWHSVVLAVPMLVKDAQKTGTIIEALAAYSEEVVNAYYDTTLYGKVVRDEESREMLDIIFSTRTFDLGWFYQIGGYNEGVMNLMRNYNTDFTSMYTKVEKSAVKTLEKYNKTFRENMEAVG